MPQFKYSARDKDGKPVEGVIEQPDKDEAVNVLQAKGFMPLSVELEKIHQLRKAGPKKLKQKLKTEDLMLFCRQLTTLLNAGVTLLRALAIVLRQMESRPLFNAVEMVRDDVEAGLSLHESMAKHPKIFSTLWISLIETGEASGQLSITFEHLAQYLESSGATMRKVSAAMVYPIILLTVCLAAILIFTLKIIPMFGEIYKGFNMELPGLTAMVLAFSKFMQRYIIFVIIGAIALSFAFKLFTKTVRGRIIYDGIVLKVPLWGDLTKCIIIERFAYTLSILIKSGIPILTGLDTIARVCDNKIFEKVIYSVKDDVRSGKPMSGMLEAAGIFPIIVTQMIGVGEETGKLSEMLERVANYYRDIMDSMVEKMTAAFEPLILIFMGSTIGVLVVAMYLPIFKIASGMSPTQ